MNLSLPSFALLGCFVALAACSSKPDTHEAVGTTVSHIEGPDDDDDDDSTGAASATDDDDDDQSDAQGDDDDTSNDQGDDDDDDDQSDYVDPTNDGANTVKGDEGAACDADSDCADGLVCGPAADEQTNGNTTNYCQQFSEMKADVGDSCVNTSDCMDGLSCMPAAGQIDQSMCE